MLLYINTSAYKETSHRLILMVSVLDICFRHIYCAGAHSFEKEEGALNFGRLRAYLLYIHIHI